MTSPLRVLSPESYVELEIKKRAALGLAQGQTLGLFTRGAPFPFPFHFPFLSTFFFNRSCGHIGGPELAFRGFLFPLF
jgi:hypothetical protein